MQGITERTAFQPHCPAMSPVSKTALVAEGGGQRGIYTAGILDSWLHKGFNPFELFIGASAGAQNLSSYFTCQKGFARQAISKLTRMPQFFDLKRSLLKRHAVDLDWYFDQFEGSTLSLNIDSGIARFDERKLVFAVTDASSRRAEFLSPTKDNWLQLLKASSAYPLLYRHGVQIGGQQYVDGGLAAPIPVQEAYAQGARKIVVIRTVPKDAAFNSPWVHKLKSWMCSSHRCPTIIDLITHHENEYEKALEFINNPPSDAEIIQIFPEKPLGSKLVNSQGDHLDQDYENGVEAGLHFVSRFGSTFVA